MNTLSFILLILSLICHCGVIALNMSSSPGILLVEEHDTWFGTVFVDLEPLALDKLHDSFKSDDEMFFESLGIHAPEPPHHLQSLKHADHGVWPPKMIHVSSFYLTETSISVSEFLDFVAETGHETKAEKQGWSFVLEEHVNLPPTVPDKSHLLHDPWSPHWVAAPGANWKHPLGHGSAASPDHPVVHVSHRDAAAFCKYHGMRLPGEREYESAAREGKSTEINVNSIPHGINAIFNHHPNSTVPIREFEANDFGFYQLLGNVHEWVRGGSEDARILRGGSFLDTVHFDDTGGLIVRASTRTTAPSETTAYHIGFRCALSATASSTTKFRDEL